jgi:glyoxylase-like metal-dependent hydrolase (beta-lactamase superfamily II)
LIAPTWAQSARYQRIAVGACEVTILSDGHMVVPTGMLAGNVPAADLTAFLAARALGPDRVHFHLNVALVKVAGELILIDTGAGGTWEATAGLLPDSLEQAGIQSSQISKIVLTHAHPDHLWGLVDDLDNSLRFPNARYFVTAREFDFWSLGEAAKLAGPIEGMALAATRIFKMIEARTTRLKPGDEIVPGLVTIDTSGHTPGHVSLVLTSGAAKLLITADAIQNAHISLTHPDWEPRADIDGARAASSRRRLLDMAATDTLRVLAYHIPFPGLGRIERKDAAYRWVSEA